MNTALALTLASYFFFWAVTGLAYTASLVVLDKDSQIVCMLRTDRDPFAMIVAVLAFSFIAPLFLALYLLMSPVRLYRKIARIEATELAEDGRDFACEQVPSRMAS